MKKFLKTPINQTATKENPKSLSSNLHLKNPTTQKPNTETPFSRHSIHFPYLKCKLISSCGKKKRKKKSLITIDGNKEFNQYMHCNFIDFYYTDFF